MSIWYNPKLLEGFNDAGFFKRLILMVMLVDAGKSTEETPEIYKYWTELTEELEIEQLC